MELEAFLRRVCGHRCFLVIVYWVYSRGPNAEQQWGMDVAEKRNALSVELKRTVERCQIAEENERVAQKKLRELEQEYNKSNVLPML